MVPLTRFSDKVAVVTGGASGIGEATVRRLHAEGAAVVVGDVNGDRMDSLQSELGDRLTSMHCDVTRERDVADLIGAAVEGFGRLDAAFNVAGGGPPELIQETEESAWRSTIDLSLTSVFLSIKHEARQMIEQGGGSIVNVASICAQIPVFGGAAYCCAKAAVEMLTKVAALELGEHGIRVNAVLPGFTATPGMASAVDTIGAEYIGQTPLARIAQPEDIAAALVFLASEDARHISGASMFVDGAFSAAGHFDLRPFFPGKEAEVTA